MSPKQRFYLVGQSCVGAAIVNAIINCAIGWGITRGFTQVPMWRIPGIVGDLVATAFGVAFGTCVCMALQVPWDLRRGKMTPVALPSGIAAVVARLPVGTFQRSMGLGAVAIVLFALPVVAVLTALGRGAMDRAHYIVLKTALSAVEGAVVTPLIVLAALADASPCRVGREVRADRF